jgi:hypothetical protein
MGKSKLHIELAQRALIWLEAKATNRGIRGCEEVILDGGYVADSAAISGLTLKNESLFLGKSRDWSSKESDDLIWIFESKVSRNDFHNTFKRDNHSGSRLKPIGNFHFIVCPYKMLSKEDAPEFWGILEQRGTGLGIVKMPTFCETSTADLHRIAYLLLRSNHERKFGIFSYELEKFRKEQEQIELQLTI